MADIRQIQIRVVTRDRSHGGTNDNVYLGLGGREFHLDTKGNDFESPSDQTFILGESTDVKDVYYNDPGNPSIDTEDELANFPVYLRKAGTVKNKTGGADTSDDAWIEVDQVIVTVNSGPDQIIFRRDFSGARERGLRLSNETGLIIYLKPDREVPSRDNDGIRSLTITATANVAR